MVVVGFLEVHHEPAANDVVIARQDCWSTGLPVFVNATVNPVELHAGVGAPMPVQTEGEAFANSPQDAFVVEVGVAPVRPAEFIVFRISEENAEVGPVSE